MTTKWGLGIWVLHILPQHPVSYCAIWADFITQAYYARWQRSPSSLLQRSHASTMSQEPRFWIGHHKDHQSLSSATSSHLLSAHGLRTRKKHILSVGLLKDYLLVPYQPSSLLSSRRTRTRLSALRCCPSRHNVAMSFMSTLRPAKSQTTLRAMPRLCLLWVAQQTRCLPSARTWWNDRVHRLLARLGRKWARELKIQGISRIISPLRMERYTDCRDLYACYDSSLGSVQPGCNLPTRLLTGPESPAWLLKLSKKFLMRL